MQSKYQNITFSGGTFTMLFLGVLFCYSVLGTNAIYYDSFRGVPIETDEYEEHVAANNTFWCVNNIKQCNPDEYRRIDGSCNSLKYPSRGATHTPFSRILPPIFSDKVSESKKAKSGNDLPLERYTRTSLLLEGRLPDKHFSLLVPNFFLFMSGDITNVHDTISMAVWHPNCCQPEGLKDDMCFRSIVPNDDPVLRYSNHRCLSLTKPISFQNTGCLHKDTSAERLVSATPVFDMSNLYGNTEEACNERGRAFEGGLLKTETVEGRIWPPTVPADKQELNLCGLNQKPHETRCHYGPEPDGNGLLGNNLFIIWSWRLHNVFAKKLAEINPGWDDDKLFYTARDINIAVTNQIFYYELLPILYGRSYLQRLGVICNTNGFRDVYNENLAPQVALEGLFAMRWVHTLQEGILKLYDTKGHYVKEMPVVNMTLRTGNLAVDNNIDYLTQGAFRQAAGKNDAVYDPDMANRALGDVQAITDLPAHDLVKNRLSGLQPYVKYYEYCTGKKIKCFADLKNVMEPEHVERLADTYESVEDVDLLAGLWLEKPIKGGYVSPTFACLVGKQLLHNVWSDRHWYERPNRPNAFTYAQLQEIRKMTISKYLCKAADKVTEIQREGFFRMSSKNPLVPCDSIPDIDLEAWRDPNATLDSYTE